jgi:LTXXQ motif family protein
MRRQMLVFSVVAFAMLGPFAGPACAQFALSPRGLLGAVSQPLRGLFGHFHHRAERHRPVEHAATPEPKAADSSFAKNPTEPNAREAVADRSNPSDVVLGYAFWPNHYGNDFARYGFGTITAAIVGPLTAMPTADRRRQMATTGQGSGSAASARYDFLPPCDISDTATGDWVSGQIKRELRPTPAQLTALDNVRNQLIEGATAIRSRCRASNSDSPLERLGEFNQRIWAIHNADVLARPSIEAFYNTLTDSQKAVFKNVTPPPAQSRTGAGAPMGERYQACAKTAGDTAQALIDAIASRVQPTGEQQASLNNFGKVSAQMEKMLLASCAQPPADSPLGRFDAADDQLVTINYAASNMEIMLNAFYSTLTEDQKANFDSFGREAARRE